MSPKVSILLLIYCRFRRKPILVGSMLGMAICQFALGIYFSTITETESYQLTYNQTVDHDPARAVSVKAALQSEEINYSWVPIPLTCLGLFLGNTGWFSVTWVVVSEMLPNYVVINRLMICFAYISAFISTKTFADLVQSIHPHGAFFLYGCIGIFGALFTLCLVPETKKIVKNGQHRETYTSVPTETAPASA